MTDRVPAAECPSLAVTWTVRTGLGSPAGSVMLEGTQLRLQPPPSFTVVPINVKKKKKKSGMGRGGGIHLSRLASVSCDPETQEPPLTQQVINNPLAVLLPQRLPALASPVSSAARRDAHPGQGQGLLPAGPHVPSPPTGQGRGGVRLPASPRGPHASWQLRRGSQCC